MNLRYNLYRIYQIIPHISYDLVSNKYQVIISLFLGKSRIPLQIKESNWEGNLFYGLPELGPEKRRPAEGEELK